MPKMLLILGASSSGKSRFAESILAKTEAKRYYIATMRPCTEDNFRRIERHRQQRIGLGAKTLELPCTVAEAPVSPGAAVLLEDVSNLLANAMFEEGRDAESVYMDICALQKRCELLILVSISGLNGEGFDMETQAYINSLEKLNSLLLASADTALVMEQGKPSFLKGDINGYI